MILRCFSRNPSLCSKLLYRSCPRQKPYLPSALQNKRLGSTAAFARPQPPSADSTTQLAPKSQSPQRIVHSVDTGLARAAKILSSDTPKAEKIQEALSICEALAKVTVLPDEAPRAPKVSGITPTSDLLGLDAKPNQEQVTIERSKAERVRLARSVSRLALDIVEAPQIFLTVKHLVTYVNIQSILKKPQSFPAVFDLYANKPVPQPGTSPVKYKDAKPNAISAAIPLKVAEKALDAAINIKNLPLALSIIDTTVNTTAFRRSKFVSKALLPCVVFACAPLVAYIAGIKMTEISNALDPREFQIVATAGVLAYITFTGTLGFVAVTTANDQMERITWVIGTPLRERWMREEERALVDKVAMAWGFRSKDKRGDEEGQDWQNLRLWSLERGMVLDKPELMEGMQ